jgi:putative hydrolase
MSDNLFERFFELFNQPGPVNWMLAEELATNLAGDEEPVDPWMADEYAEMGSLALLRTSEIPILPDLTDGRIDPVDRAVWTRDNLHSFDYLAEALGGGGDSTSPMAPLMASMAGMQVGSLVGTLSHHALGGFDVGLLALAPRGYLIVPTLESFARSHQLDARQVRLWAALQEAMHLRISRLTWLGDRYASLLRSWIAGIEFDASGLIGQLQEMANPTAAQEAIEGLGDIQSLLSQSSNQADRDDAVALLALLAGLRRHLMDDFGEQWLPELPGIRLGLAQRAAEPEAHSALTVALPTHDEVVEAADFCAEVERRWGRDTLGKVIGEPGSLPYATEMSDPVGWAARVLLD